MKHTLKKMIALLAVLSLEFSFFPMFPNTTEEVKAAEQEDRILNAGELDALHA